MAWWWLRARLADSSACSLSMRYQSCGIAKSTSRMSRSAVEFNRKKLTNYDRHKFRFLTYATRARKVFANRRIDLLVGVGLRVYIYGFLDGLSHRRPRCITRSGFGSWRFLKRAADVRSGFFCRSRSSQASFRRDGNGLRRCRNFGGRNQSRSSCSGGEQSAVLGSGSDGRFCGLVDRRRPVRLERFLQNRFVAFLGDFLVLQQNLELFRIIFLIRWCVSIDGLGRIRPEVSTSERNSLERSSRRRRDFRSCHQNVVRGWSRGELSAGLRRRRLRVLRNSSRNFKPACRTFLSRGSSSEVRSCGWSFLLGFSFNRFFKASPVQLLRLIDDARFAVALADAQSFGNVNRFRRRSLNWASFIRLHF